MQMGICFGPLDHSGIRPSPDPGTFTGLIVVLDPAENFEVSGLIPALENLGLEGGSGLFQETYLKLQQLLDYPKTSSGP